MDAQVAPSLTKLRESTASFTMSPSAFASKLPGKLEGILNMLSSQKDCLIVPGWSCDPKYLQMMDGARKFQSYCASRSGPDTGTRQSVHKVARQKGVSSGRTYTSKYRGVHQTFPTRRWEAQFRRNGKPTSLGCFDHEDEAARAYDRMMVWCELHGQDGRGGKVITHRSSVAHLSLNFDYGDYEGDLVTLKHVSQDDLVQSLRRQGRLQAASNNIGSLMGSST